MPSLLLSPFQKEKLEYYFRFLCPDENGNLEKNSLERLMTKILDFTGWDEDSRNSKECREVHQAFFEILFEKTNETGPSDHVTLENWFSLWSNLLPGVMGMSNLPVWLRLMPRLLFGMIDRRGEGVLSENDLAIYYRNMIHIDNADQVAKSGFAQMTDHGRYPLKLASYEQLFANFLIGRTPYGPGRFIFGCFEHEVRPFQLIQPAAEADDDDDIVMEVRPYSQGRRPSRQLVSFS